MDESHCWQELIRVLSARGWTLEHDRDGESLQAPGGVCRLYRRVLASASERQALLDVHARRLADIPKIYTMLEAADDGEWVERIRLYLSQGADAVRFAYR